MGAPSTSGVAMFVRLDEDLDVVWFRNRHLDPPHHADNAFLRTVELSTGELVMAGLPDWLYKADASGNTVWSRVTQDASAVVRDLAAAADDGTWLLLQDANEDVHVLRHNPDGTLRWARRLVPPAGHAAAYSDEDLHLDVLPRTCDAAPLHGGVCALPGDRCATASTLCTCEAGSTWSCTPGAQGALLSWRVTGATHRGVVTTGIDADGDAVSTALLSTATRVHDQWVGPQGDVNLFVGGARLIRLDEGLGGACAPTPMPDVRLDPSPLTSSPATTRTYGGFPALTVRQTTAAPAVTTYPAPTASVSCAGESCP